MIERIKPVEPLDRELELDAEVFRLLRNWQDRYRTGQAMLEAIKADLAYRWGGPEVTASARRVASRLIRG